MKVKTTIAKTVYETREVEVPFYSIMDFGDREVSMHYVRHEADRHVTITVRGYYNGHRTFEIEVQNGIGAPGYNNVDVRPSTEAEFNKAWNEGVAFMKSLGLEARS